MKNKKLSSWLLFSFFGLLTAIYSMNTYAESKFGLKAQKWLSNGVVVDFHYKKNNRGEKASRIEKKYRNKESHSHNNRHQNRTEFRGNQADKRTHKKHVRKTEEKRREQYLKGNSPKESRILSRFRKEIRHANKLVGKHKDAAEKDWKMLQPKHVHKDGERNRRPKSGYRESHKKHKHNDKYNDNHRYSNKSRILVKHHNKKRPHYKLYKRKKHIYYKTPWYNTRYIAPIPRVRLHVGHRVNVLPKTHVRLTVGGLPYFYNFGLFYRFRKGSYVAVTAPFGAMVQTLPVGFIAFTMGLSTYYYFDDVYYRWDEPQSSYVVIERPRGAERAIEEQTGSRLYVYPNTGQDADQQAKDRYECHRWAVKEMGTDPTVEGVTLTVLQQDQYKRAISACLEGRDYTVK